MGVCKCNKTVLIERHFEENAYDSDNLVLKGNELINQKANKVKSTKNNIINKIRISLRNIGDILTEKEFNDYLPEKYKLFLIEHPYSDEKEDCIEQVVELEPFEFVNGNLYKGQWNANGRISGRGIYYLKEDKVLVEGVWEDGICKRGMVLLPEGQYEGEIEDNLFNGNGKMIYNDGRIYEGDWSKGNKEGNGCLTWPDGSKYWGQFKNDMINGEGEFNWANGYYYKGEIKEDAFNGYGTLKGKKGSIYTGNFKGGAFHGSGKFIWNSNDKSNKEKYIGDYCYGKKEGYGRYIFSNGDIYEGEWFNNRPHGQGQYETKNKIYKSIWRNGQIGELPIVEIKEGGDPDEPELTTFSFEIKLEDIDYTQLLYLHNNDLLDRIKINGQEFLSKEYIFDSMV